MPSPALVEPFGLGTMPVMNGELLTKWSGVEADIRAENDILFALPDGRRALPGGGTTLPVNRYAGSRARAAVRASGSSIARSIWQSAR